MGMTLYKQLTVDDTDILQNAQSQLRRPRTSGRFQLWWGSDQADGELTVIVSGVNVVEKSNMPLITANALKIEGPPLAEFYVGPGVDVVINYNEVTAGTASILIKFADMQEVALEAA